MKIFVKVRPNSKKESMEKIDDTHFAVAVNEPPHEGRANEALIKILAGYFGVKAEGIKIIIGRKSKQKIIEIK